MAVDETAAVSRRQAGSADQLDGDVKASDNAGGDNAGGDNAGGDNAGGNSEVSDNAGGDSEGGAVPAAGAGRGGRIAAIVAAAVIGLLGIAYVIGLITTSGTMAKGTAIGGVDVGGLTPAEAEAKVTAQLQPLTQPMVVHSHQVSLTLDPATAGLKTDIPGSIAAVGTRSANPFSMVGSLFGATRDEPLLTAVDSSALTAALTAQAAATDVAPVEGQVAVTGTTVDVVQPVVGQKLQVADAVKAVTQAWTSGNPASLTDLDLIATASPVRASAAGVQQAATEAKALLSGPLTVQADTTPIAVPLETLAAAVTITPNATDGFTVAIDQAAVKAAYQAAVDATQRQPVNAKVTIVNDAPVLEPGLDGLTVDWPATDAALLPALQSPAHVLTVVYAHAQPALTTEAAQALGIKEVVSEFTTSGFAYDSGQNVKRTAEMVQGAIVMPGETFSLNGFTGPRGAEQGFVEAGIIQDGVPARAIGGGISQFATTLFNASYFAGMEDVEHKAHSYYISRYPEGREATVFEAEDGSSVIDVKFKNVSATAIMIQTVWTENDITVRFWGTKTVNVTSEKTDRYDYTSPRTKTIPYGQKCTASNGTQGFSVDVTRIITDLAGNEVSRQTSTTVYNGQMHIICEPPPAPKTTATTPPPPTTGG